MRDRARRAVGGWGGVGRCLARLGRGRGPSCLGEGDGALVRVPAASGADAGLGAPRRPWPEREVRARFALPGRGELVWVLGRLRRGHGSGSPRRPELGVRVPPPTPSSSLRRGRGSETPGRLSRRCRSGSPLLPSGLRRGSGSGSPRRPEQGVRIWVPLLSSGLRRGADLGPPSGPGREHGPVPPPQRLARVLGNGVRIQVPAAVWSRGAGRPPCPPRPELRVVCGKSSLNPSRRVTDARPTGFEGAWRPSDFRGCVMRSGAPAAGP